MVTIEDANHIIIYCPWHAACTFHITVIFSKLFSSWTQTAESSDASPEKGYPHESDPLLVSAEEGLAAQVKPCKFFSLSLSAALSSAVLVFCLLSSPLSQSLSILLLTIFATLSQ